MNNFYQFFVDPIKKCEPQMIAIIALFDSSLKTVNSRTELLGLKPKNAFVSILNTNILSSFVTIKTSFKFN